MRSSADGFEPAVRYGFVDIHETGTSLALNDDDYTTANIGFPFTFYGRTASSLTVSNNGGILFDQAAGTRGRNGYLSPVNRTLPDRMIGPRDARVLGRHVAGLHRRHRQCLRADARRRAEPPLRRRMVQSADQLRRRRDHDVRGDPVRRQQRHPVPVQGRRMRHRALRRRCERDDRPQRGTATTRSFIRSTRSR